jgi:hypothetical protein
VPKPKRGPDQSDTPTEASHQRQGILLPWRHRKSAGQKVEHHSGQYRNNRLEQDHRGVKGRYKVMRGFKNPESAERFCQAYDEVRNFFSWRRWHKDRRREGWKRANFKSKFFQLKKKFSQKKLVWNQSAMLL